MGSIQDLSIENQTLNGNTESHPLEIDPDMEETMVPRFDALVAKGEIMWAPYKSEPVEHGGFKAVFQLCPHLRKKPIQSADAPERKTGKGDNPFMNPNPTFVLTQVGSTHTVMLNKYCVYRPSLILHTKEFVPQTADLDQSDFQAAWTVLNAIRKKPYMMIYNCGIDSGSSQGHKHMQLWEYPTKDEIGFDLFPSHAKSTTEITSSIPHVPHRHFVLRLPKDSSSKFVFDAYQRLLVEVNKCHKQCGSTAYNVVLTHEWLCLIPRRSSGGERGAGSNAAGVLGLIWITTEGEKDIWTYPDLTDFMQYLGVPIEGYSTKL